MSAPIPNFPPLPMVRWKHFQRDFFEAFLRANFDWLRGTTGMPIAKAASTAFYKDIVLLPSLLQHLANIPEADHDLTYMLVRWDSDIMHFFEDVDYTSVNKHLVMEKLIECFSATFESCIIVIRRSTATNDSFECRVIAHGIYATDLFELDFHNWFPISLPDLEFPAYVFIGPHEAKAFVKSNRMFKMGFGYLPL